MIRIVPIDLSQDPEKAIIEFAPKLPWAAISSQDSAYGYQDREEDESLSGDDDASLVQHIGERFTELFDNVYGDRHHNRSRYSYQKALKQGPIVELSRHHRESERGRDGFLSGAASRVLRLVKAQTQLRETLSFAHVYTYTDYQGPREGYSDWRRSHYKTRLVLSSGVQIVEMQPSLNVGTPEYEQPKVLNAELSQVEVDIEETVDSSNFIPAFCLGISVLEMCQHIDARRDKNI